jgi:PAS domain S-box-containing protein
MPHCETTRRDRLTRIGALFDVSSLGVTIVGPDGCILECNAAYERLLGYREAELRGRHVTTLSDPEMAAETMALLGEVYGGARDSFMIEKTYRRRDGAKIWARLTVAAVRAPGGTLEHTIGLVEDITESRRIAAALRESEARYRSILETLPVIIYRVDAEPPYRLRYISEEARRVAPIDEWLGDDPAWPKYVHPEDRERVMAAVDAARGPVGEQDVEYRMIARDGSVHWFRDRGSMLRGTNGEAIAFQGVMLDITEKVAADAKRRELEEQLRQAQKLEAVGQLAGGIAHDFNNILTVISGRAEFLRDARPGSAGWAEDVDEVLQAASRASRLTRQLLAFSRKQMMQPRRLDTDAVVQALAPMLERLIGEDLELAVVQGAGEREIFADPGQLEQILVNLIVNARDAMPHGGSVVIATRIGDVDAGSPLARENEAAPGEYVVLSVADTGVGIDPAVARRIFEPFFTTKEPGQGTGLGLATVYGIAKQSGGFVTVVSEKGRGSRFDVYFPAHERTVSSEPATETVATGGGSETILLVEDSDAVRDLTERLLRNLGYTVLTARNGAEALEVAAACEMRIDLLLTDVVMPRMNGRQLSEVLTAKTPSLRTLYMSGYTDDVIVRKGLRLPGNAFLEKPFTSEALAQRVRALLDGAANPSAGRRRAGGASRS